MRQADLDHDRIVCASSQRLDRVALPRVAMRVAGDDDELTAIDRMSSAGGSSSKRRSSVSGTIAWNHSPGSCDSRPAAIPTSGTSSTTSGLRVRRAGPSTRSGAPGRFAAGLVVGRDGRLRRRPPPARSTRAAASREAVLRDAETFRRRRRVRRARARRHRRRDRGRDTERPRLPRSRARRLPPRPRWRRSPSSRARPSRPGRRTRARPRRRSWSISRLIVAGVSPLARTTMCAVMIERAPASIAARKGVSAPSSSDVDDRNARCESTEVSPCPGKCFAHAATPALWRPRTNAATCLATSAGSSPNERIPITGFCGFVLTSATGAKSRLTPTLASSAPSDAATRSVSTTSSTTPSAPLPGYELPRSASSRVTSPPSSSIAMSTPSRSARSSDVSARSWSRLSTFHA